MVKRVVVESSCIPILRSSMFLLVRSDVLEFGLCEGYAVFRLMGRVDVVKEGSLVSEPVNVDLKQCDKCYGNCHDGTASQAGLGTIAKLIGRQEEESSEADTFEVKCDEYRSECSNIEQTASFEVVDLVAAPSKLVLVRGVKNAESEEGEDGDDWLDNRVDDSDADD